MGFTPNNFRCDFLQILTDGLILKNKSCMDFVLFMQISFPLFIFRVSFPLPFPWSRPAVHLLFSRQSITAYRWRMICLHIRETEKFAFTHHKWVVWYTLSGLTRSAKLATVWFAVASPEAFLVVSFVKLVAQEKREMANGQVISEESSFKNADGQKIFAKYWKTSEKKPRLEIIILYISF